MKLLFYKWIVLEELKINLAFFVALDSHTALKLLKQPFQLTITTYDLGLKHMFPVCYALMFECVIKIHDREPAKGRFHLKKKLFANLCLFNVSFEMDPAVRFVHKLFPFMVLTFDLIWLYRQLRRLYAHMLHSWNMCFINDIIYQL